MFGNSRMRIGWMVLTVIPMALLISGCASGNKSISGADAGTILKYRMPQEQVLQYLLTNRSTQTLDIRGQSVDIASDDIRSISLKSQGREQDQYRIGVTIDSMNMMLATPQGVIAPDLSGLAGRGFEFSLSTAGLETDFSESESLEYELAPGQTENAITGFQAFFPNLPSRPVKIGDTWISKDTVTAKTARGELCLIFESKNKLEGFETVDGLKCVKITADVKGTLDGKGEE